MKRPASEHRFNGMESLQFMPNPTPLRPNVIADPPEVEIIAVTADAARNVTENRHSPHK